MNLTVRCLAAVALAVFVVTSVPVYFVGVPGAPWWLPFAAAFGFTALIAAMLTIIVGPSIFTEKK